MRREFPISSSLCLEMLQKNFVIKQVKLKSFGKKKRPLMSLQGFIHLWVPSFSLRDVC